MPVVGEFRVDVRGIQRELDEMISKRDSLNINIAAMEVTLETIRKFRIVADTSEQEDEVTNDHTAEHPEFEGMTMAGIAEFILTTSDKPMRAGDIVTEMMSYGFQVEDRVKTQNAVFTAMDRKKEVFTKVGSGLWELRSRLNDPLN